MPCRLVHSACAADRLRVANTWLDLHPAGAPLTVLASSAFAASELLHDVAVRKGALFGWQHDTLTRHAVELAAPRLADAGLAPAGALVVEALAAKSVNELTVAGELGRFTPVADQPGLPRALSRILLELRAQHIAPDTLRDTRPELARLLDMLERALASAHMADRATIFTMAADEVRRRRESPPLLLLDVPVASQCEADLIAALASRAAAVLATVPSGDTRSLERLAKTLDTVPEELRTTPRNSLERLQQHLFGAPPEEHPLDDHVLFMSAPGESRECVEIARRVLAAAEQGVPFDRMAVLLRAPDRYRSHVEEAMRRARVPIYLARGSVKPDPAGRALIALMACASEGLSARRFAEYLSLGELPESHNGSPPPPLPDTERWVVPDEELLAPPTPDAEPDTPTGHTLAAPRRWERLLVDAAVIGGRDRWKRRLDGLAGELRAELDGLEDPNGPHADGILRRIQDLSTLRNFALPLLDDLAALPQAATWGAWIEKLGALATRAIAKPTRVLSVLAELMPMRDLGPIDLRQVLIVLERRLSLLVLPPVARHQGRVLVAPCESARGMSFDWVFIPGLAERLFPQKVIEDPMLRDVERAAVSSWLPTEDDRVDAERLQLRVAVGAAAERVVVSYPRLDIDQARPRVPSFYGLEVMHAATGRLPGFDELGRHADEGGAARIGWPAPSAAIDAIDAAEHDLALLDGLLRLPEAESVGTAHYLLDANPHLGRALRFRARRWIPRWTPADGFVQPSGLARTLLTTQTLAERSYSATALQNYARCPYRFFLYSVMRLSPREEARAIEELDPLQRGSLVHDIQFELLEKLRHDGALPITFKNLQTAQATLDEVLERVSAKYHDDLAPAIERVWLDAVASVRADLREWLRLHAEDTLWTPWRFELAFGLHSRLGRDPASQKEAVALDCGIQLRGAIDLVERDRTGALRATDHKTGKVRAKEDALIGGGETLQPVLYALALEKLMAGETVVEGRLYYCTETGRFEERNFPLDEEARAAAQLVADTIGTALTEGFLPAAPAARECAWCDYQTLCGPYEEQRVRKKKKHELLPLSTLRKTR